MVQLRYVPLNRHLLLEDVDLAEKSPSPVLVPDEYKVVRNFGIYSIVEAAIDCDTFFQNGEMVVVEESMVREVELPGDKKYYVLPENLVILRVSKAKESSHYGNPYNED